MHDPRTSLYKTKLTLLATLLSVAGLALMIAAKALASRPGWHWLTNLPISEIGSTLFVAGLLSIALDYFDGRDREERDTQRLGRAIENKAPTIVQAALDGMVASADHIAILSPDQQDQLIRNGLTARLTDADFAAEVYGDIRDQAIRAAERWHDAKVEIKLSPLPMGSGSSAAAPPPEPSTVTPEPMFVVTVRWEYSVIPRHAVRRFVCVADKEEYRELTEDSGATSVWFMRPKNGILTGSREAFELVQFTVDGDEHPIRRSTRKDGQTYTVALGQPVMAADKPVMVSYTFRTLVSVASHVLNIDFEQPTRGIQVELDYGDVDIQTVSVIDSIASSKQARILRTPKTVPGRSVSVEFDGWAFPRSGVAFVWGDAGSQD